MMRVTVLVMGVYEVFMGNFLECFSDLLGRARVGYDFNFVIEQIEIVEMLNIWVYCFI